MSSEERAKLKGALTDISTNGPKAEAGAVRIKRLLGQVTGAAGDALRKAAVDIASETVKKILTGS
jgi:hypothetical protein